METFPITNYLAREFRATLRACQERCVFRRFKLRYAADRSLDGLEAALKTYDSDHRKLLDEYVVKDERGRFLAETPDGRVLYPGEPNGLIPGQNQPYEIEVQAESGKVERRPYRGPIADFHIDPERREEFQERHERLLRSVIEVELYLVPESEFEREGAIDLEALDGNPPETPRILFSMVRRAMIRGNQTGFLEGADEDELPTEESAGEVGEGPAGEVEA